MSELVGLHNGTTLPLVDMRIGLSERGMLQGAFIVDRLRTIKGSPLTPHSHAERFCDNIARIGLEAPQVQRVVEWIFELCETNQTALDRADLSIVLLASPARDLQAKAVDFWLYPSPIDWNKLATHYRFGQRLHIARTRNVPNECWDVRLKNRSRLHYFLADQEVFNATGDKWAAPVLLDVNGNVTETSAANIILVEGDRLASPPLDSIFAGLAVKRNLRIWEQLNVTIRFEPISEQRLLGADAIVLSNSTGLAWHASQINDRALSAPSDTSFLRVLQNHLIDSLKFDFINQAIQLASLDCSAS